MPMQFPVSGGGNFKGLPSGSYGAICDMIVFLGLQPGSGMYPDPKYQVYLRWQVPSERVDFEKDGKKISGPAVIGKTFTASMHKKANIRSILESWRGKTFTEEEAAAFDVSTVLGKACLLGVVEKESGGKIYSNISSIGSIPRGMQVPTAEGNLLYYADDETGMYDHLPAWLKKKLDERIKPTQARSVVVDQGDNGTYAFDDAPPASSYENDAPFDDSDPIPF